MPENNCGCSCGKSPTLIFPCSGAADVGEISDRVARKLTRDNVGKMFCLAGIGGHVDNIILSTSAAGKVFVIDGCPVDCAKKTLEHANIDDFVHMRVTDFGCVKGKSPATDETIAGIISQAKNLLSQKECC
ncbi:MAG: putative zinc-binding protein [Candidatus Latescibacteria bacterium]|nr:putative zinc-binding protein [Candidatus Latescibacterota bacterium]